MPVVKTVGVCKLGSLVLTAAGQPSGPGPRTTPNHVVLFRGRAFVVVSLSGLFFFFCDGIRANVERFRFQSTACLQSS